MAEPTSPYLDQNGRPRLRQSIVAFIDILGFSQIATSSASMDESQQILDRIAAAIDDSRRFVRQPIADGEAALGIRWATKFFSDNLAFGYPFDDAIGPAAIAWLIIRSAQRYQLKMTMNGFFVRGALTQGPICLTDEIIFGAALIECYLLESKASIVPRIVLAEPLQQLVVNAYRKDPTSRPEPGIDQAICRDVDGWWFVNYLDATVDFGKVQWELIEQHKASILSSLSQTTRHDVLPKYGWACRYHNVFCYWHREDPGYSDNYRISRVDEHSTIHRLEEAAK